MARRLQKWSSTRARRRPRRRSNGSKRLPADRFDDIELNCLIGFVLETDDKQSIVNAMAPAVNIGPDDALHMPLALVGTKEEMEEELYWRRENYGFSYFSIETYESLFTTESAVGNPGSDRRQARRAINGHDL